MSSILITPMTTEEQIEGKAYVQYASWKSTYRGLIDPDYLDGLTLEACLKKAHLYKSNVLIAMDGDRVIGFIGYGRSEDPDFPDCGEIFALYVLDEYQGKRVGYALMTEALSRLSEYDKIILWVLKGNRKGLGFYERYGFSLDGGEKEIILGKPATELRMIYNRQK